MFTAASTKRNDFVEQELMPKDSSVMYDLADEPVSKLDSNVGRISLSPRDVDGCL